MHAHGSKNYRLETLITSLATDSPTSITADLYVILSSIVTWASIKRELLIV